jgi:Fe-S cluster assembly protein SufD
MAAHLSSTTHEGIDVCLSSALNKPKYKTVIDTYIRLPIKESLTSLNTAFANEGDTSISRKSKVADKPIEIMYFSTVRSRFLVQPRNLVIVGENAHVQIIESVKV